jgi:hypothetical protein
MMGTLLGVLQWLARHAGAGRSLADNGPWDGPTTADRAGRLLAVPEDALEQDVSRSLAAHWALWLAVALIVLILAAGFIRRRWRTPGGQRPAWLTRKGPR